MARYCTPGTILETGLAAFGWPAVRPGSVLIRGHHRNTLRHLLIGLAVIGWQILHQHFLAKLDRSRLAFTGCASLRGLTFSPAALQHCPVAACVLHKAFG